MHLDDLWNRTKTVTLSLEEIGLDDQEPPRNHQGTGVPWTPESLFSVNRFYITIHWTAAAKSAPLNLKEKAIWKFDQTYIWRSKCKNIVPDIKHGGGGIVALHFGVFLPPVKLVHCGRSNEESRLLQNSSAEAQINHQQDGWDKIECSNRTVTPKHTSKLGMK